MKNNLLNFVSILFLLSSHQLIPHKEVMKTSSIFFSLETFDFSINKDDLQEFATFYKQRPIKNNAGGMKSVGMFWIWFITKKISPNLIIESGIWKGQSSWLLEQAAPRAKIISIDPMLNYREYISPKIVYNNHDFSTLSFGDLSNLKTLCFFDDHQDVFPRICQAKEKGFKHLLFDDNYPVEAGSHKSLTHYLAENSDKTTFLKTIIKRFIILPQITSNRMINLQEGTFESMGLGIPLEGDLKILEEDSYSYRWTTYLELW